MLFSYYFNPEKTHLLNCRFRVLQFVERAEGVDEIMFSAEIAEVFNNTTRKRETQVATFSFPPTPEGDVQHDIDFSRIRFGDQKKWIFSVLNNKNNTQHIEVGLISDTINRNPLGLDVYHENSDFNVELKANNLSILESNYVPPVITQTMVSTEFDQPGYPERFSSYTARYDNVAQNYTLKDFKQRFLENIPKQTPFYMRMNIAPQVVDSPDTDHIFDVIIPDLGRISLNKSSIEYLVHDGRTSDRMIAIISDPLSPSDFYQNHRMLDKARLTIQGDGEGTLTINYCGKDLVGSYDANKEFSQIEFLGGHIGGDPDNYENYLPAKVDNIRVTYTK